jgi:S1-C subfamily serine protease
VLLLLAASLALAAPPTKAPEATPDLELTVADGTSIGLRVPGTKSAESLEKLLDTAWLSRKGATVLALGRDVAVDVAGWAAKAQAAADGVAQRKDLRLHVQITQVRLFVDDVATYAAVDGRWRVSSSWGDVAQGMLAGTARLATSDEAALDAAYADAITKLVGSLGFTTAWKETPKTPPASAQPVTVRRCAKPADTLQEAVQATVVVRTSHGVGTGEVVSMDGYVLTAAHVVRGASSVKVVLDDGDERAARIVRVAPDADVALLHVDGAVHACVVPRTASVGADLYAIGTPSGEHLAFSVSKGIVSGVRDVDGVHLVQSDVALSPGHSGGPLVDHGGGWLGVISFKVLGKGMEGLSFAVRADDALSALKVTFGERSVEPATP